MATSTSLLSKPDTAELKLIYALNTDWSVAEGPLILPEHLDLPASRRSLESDYHQQVDAFRRRLVERALAESGGNRARAGRRLGLSRQAISYLVRTLLT